MDQFIEIWKGGKLFRTVRVERNCWTYFELREDEVMPYQQDYRACEKAKLLSKKGNCFLRAWFDYSKQPFAYNNCGEPQYMASTILLQELDKNGTPQKSLSSLADFEPTVPPTAPVKHVEYEVRVHTEVAKMYKMVREADQYLRQNLAAEKVMSEILTENENVVSLHRKSGMTECEGGGYRPAPKEHTDAFLALLEDKEK